MARYGTMGWIFVASGKGKEKSNIALTFSCLRESKIIAKRSL